MNARDACPNTVTPGEARRALRRASGPALDVGLHRGLHQLGFFQRCIACLAHADEFRLGHAVMHVDVVCALFADGGFVGECTTTRTVVVADEHAGRIGQRQQALD